MLKLIGTHYVLKLDNMNTYSGYRLDLLLDRLPSLTSYHEMKPYISENTFIILGYSQKKPMFYTITKEGDSFSQEDKEAIALAIQETWEKES